MNRLVTMVLNNLWYVPGAWFKLCHYAKNNEKYSREEMYEHIRFILKRAIIGGKVDLKVTGLENIPEENGFMLYSNHQGMFDVLAIAATVPKPIGAVLKPSTRRPASAVCLPTAVPSVPVVVPVPAFVGTRKR